MTTVITGRLNNMALYAGTTYIYNTDTVHLQDALIHTALYAGTTYIYNTDTVHLQGALIHTAPYTGTTYIYNASTGNYNTDTFTGRLNTYTSTIRS